MYKNENESMVCDSLVTARTGLPIARVLEKEAYTAKHATESNIQEARNGTAPAVAAATETAKTARAEQADPLIAASVRTCC